MKLKQFALFFGIFLLTTAMLAAETPKLEGTWEGKVDHEGQMETMTYVFHVTGKTITGKVLRRGDDFGAISDGKLEGNNLSFNVSGVSFAGTLEGEQLKITITVTNGNKFYMTASRKKA